MEIWKDIPGMEGVYQVSNCGRIKALERNIRLKNNRVLPIKEHFVKGSKDTKAICSWTLLLTESES